MAQYLGELSAPLAALVYGQASPEGFHIFRNAANGWRRNCSAGTGRGREPQSDAGLQQRAMLLLADNAQSPSRGVRAGG